jgi:hypothetical protein
MAAEEEQVNSDNLTNALEDSKEDLAEPQT